MMRAAAGKKGSYFWATKNCEEFFDLDEVSAVSPGADLAKPTGKISCAVVLRAR
jgi:hypothetical protein